MNEMRKLMEALETINDDMWPHDKPFPKKPPISDVISTEAGQMEAYLEAAAGWMAAEAIELAGEVYDEEGPGEGRFTTGAKTREEYVNIAARRFLTKDVKKAVIVNFQKLFDEAVAEQLEDNRD